ncbi:MAG TPA: DUF1003 domain-containing protein [Rugosimonospora sp.]|nr:DUF1003 domain-containing protein [Rugosimonospora sp.]
MTEETITHTCSACLAMDRADGAEDGWLIPKLQKRVKNANRLVNSLRRTQDKVADVITSFAGSLQFVYLHSIWFGVWILLNIGLVGASLQFDKFPFGLLTMIVSLEAIFLSTFVMVSQNRQALRTEVRSQLDFEANLRSEVWATHIGQQLGIDPDHVEAVVARVIAQARANESGSDSAP